MDVHAFAARLERASHRVELLRASSHEDAATNTWEQAALQELTDCLDQLREAADEIRVLHRELAEARAAFEFERQRYRELFEDSPHGHVVTDIHGAVIDANQFAAQLLGAAPHGMRRRPLAQFVAAHDRERFLRWNRDLARGGGGPAAAEGVFTVQPLAAGRGFPCRLTASLSADRSGAPEIRWSLEDVSDRERARAVDRLREEGRRKDEFLAVLGHELRNPLAAIALAADLMVSGRPEDEQRRAAEVVRRNAGQLRRLVDDLLDISRVTHGRITLQRARVDVRELLVSAVDSARPLLTARGHQVAVAHGCDPVWVRGDPARLQQILSNLLDNAAKYTPPGGHVSVDLRVDEAAAAAVITVRDDGIGIPEHMLERVFDLFEQVEGASERSDCGMGLGLALVRNLVQLHGGTVRAHSHGPGTGSQFVVQLPLDGAGADRDPRHEERAAVAPARVLVVDDNIDAADLLAMSLRASGHEVLVAHTGPEALALIAEHTPVDYALVDLGLPGMDGIELGRRLRQCLPGVVLVAVTGYGDALSRQLAADAGFDHYLLKPVQPREISRILVGPPAPMREVEAG